MKPVFITFSTIYKFAAALLISLMLVIPVVHAKSPVKDLNLSSNGLALRGFDPVSYFSAGKPVEGNKTISATHRGGSYYFSSDENKQKFLSSPEKYLPQYGGFCAYGTASNYKVDGDPNVWNIVDGKLYLNINRSVDRSWKRRKATYINQADNNWPKIRNK